MSPEPAISLLNALTLFGGVQGIIIALILLGLGLGNKRANLYLAVILGILGMLLIHQFGMESGYIYKTPYLLGSVSVLDIMLAPALYLYVHTMTAADPKGIKKSWIVIPAVFMLVLMVPFHMAGFETKMALINATYRWGDLSDLLKYSFSVALIVSGLMFTIYLVLSFRLLFTHTKNIAHFFSYRERVELAWLRNLLLVMVFFWIMMIIYYLILPYVSFEGAAAARHTKLLFACLDVFTVAAIFYLGVMGLLQPNIYKPSDLNIPNSNAGSFPEDTENAHSAAKYKHSALDQPHSERILKRLLAVMEKEQPYLKNDLTLPDLAAQATTTPNYLSQVINEQLKMSFFDYVNSHRIEAAKKLLITPLPHTRTILDVAMASAFNSKSAFYSAFKKNMGITPAEFKRNCA